MVSVIYSYSVTKQMWRGGIYVLSVVVTPIRFFLSVFLFLLKLTFALIMTKSGILMDNALQS